MAGGIRGLGRAEGAYYSVVLFRTGRARRLRLVSFFMSAETAATCRRAACTAPGGEAKRAASKMVPPQQVREASMRASCYASGCMRPTQTLAGRECIRTRTRGGQLRGR